MSAYSGERLLLTLWVGSLWAIGYLAVPLAFISFETELAASFAGRLFTIVNYLGIACASILILSRFFMFGFRQFYLRWRSWIYLIMLLASVLFITYLQPEIQLIRAIEWQQDPILVEKFDWLHKLSENVYLGLSLLGLLLVLSTDKNHDLEQTS